MITESGEWGGKLMPFMRVGLTVVTVATVVCSVAQCFPPGVPTIPASIREKAKQAVGVLDTPDTDSTVRRSLTRCQKHWKRWV